jgi:tRNA 2-selenouridine synthase
METDSSTRRGTGEQRIARVPSAALAQLLARTDACVVDLRSPGEYAHDHLPGARNVPLFDDLERALIGTLYRQRSPQAAFEAARAHALARIRGLSDELGSLVGWQAPADLEPLLLAMTAGGYEPMQSELELERAPQLAPQPLVLNCWRGGMRSRSVGAFLQRLGFARAYVLEGGYESWRAHVREQLAGWRAPRTYVLRGLTGVGKTLVLRELERLRPGWTIDLEALAGHRGSVLGAVGLQPRSQKSFETGLCARIARGLAPVLVLEGESRKIGDSIVPERMHAALEAGLALELVAPLERRIDVLIADYLARPEQRGQLLARLPYLEQRLGRVSWHGRLTGLLERGEERELVRLLLERHYDPLYAHSERARVAAARFDASDPRACAVALASWIEADLAARGARP